MIKRLCFIFFLSFSLANGEEGGALEKEEPLAIQSGEVEYDGEMLQLAGQVVLEHPLGQILAKHLSIERIGNEEKKKKWGIFNIREEIQIALKEGGKLFCQEARIDYAQMKGTFLGTFAAPDVIYLSHEEKEQQPLFEIKSHQMTLHLERKKGQTIVKEIEAKERVRISYERDYLLLADEAHYERTPSSEGFLTVSAGSHCYMSNLNGDQLSAKKIYLKIDKKEMKLEEPKGTLSIKNLGGNKIHPIAFSACELIAEESGERLLLRENIHLTYNNFLHLHTKEELLIQLRKVEEKKTLSFLKTKGETEILYQDLQGKRRTMKCPGPVLIDHEHKQILLSANEAGKSVYLEDAIGEMYADHIEIGYSLENEQFIPESIVLEGHVRLMNRFDESLKNLGCTIHYALADRVQYFPKTQELLLSSTKNGRVLFYDRVNHIKMSAPSLKIRRDKKTRKEIIQGVGDVRFTFTEKELAELRGSL